MALKSNPIFKSEAGSSSFKSEASTAPTLAEAVVQYQPTPVGVLPSGSVIFDDADKADSVDLFVHTQGLPPKASEALEFIVEAQFEQSNGDHAAAVTCIDQAMGKLARWKMMLQATALLMLCCALSSCVTVLDNITGLSVTRDPSTQSWTVGATVNPYPRVTK